MSGSEAERIRNKKENQPRMHRLGWQIWADIHPSMAHNTFTLSRFHALLHPVAELGTTDLCEADDDAS